VAGHGKLEDVRYDNNHPSFIDHGRTVRPVTNSTNHSVYGAVNMAHPFQDVTQFS